MFRKFINWLCWGIVRAFPMRHRIIEIDGDPYLLRFYIKKNGILPGVYLHYFFRGDGDRDLHNHPWDISGSLILTGGYSEERLTPGTAIVKRRNIRPGTINIIRANDFHRVDLLDGPAWTIFVSGGLSQDWGFLNRETGEFIPHMRYLAEKGRPVAPDEWAND